MANNILTKPQITAKMYIKGKYVIYETIITDKRPLSYYKDHIVPGVLGKKVIKNKMIKKKATRKLRRKRWWGF